MKSRIKELAEHKGLSLWKLAEITKLSPNAFYKWEKNGLDKAQFGVMLKVAKALNCGLDDLYY